MQFEAIEDLFKNYYFQPTLIIENRIKDKITNLSPERLVILANELDKNNIHSSIIVDEIARKVDCETFKMLNQQTSKMVLLSNHLNLKLITEFGTQVNKKTCYIAQVRAYFTKGWSLTNEHKINLVQAKDEIIDIPDFYAIIDIGTNDSWPYILYQESTIVLARRIDDNEQFGLQINKIIPKSLILVKSNRLFSNNYFGYDIVSFKTIYNNLPDEVLFQ